MERTEDRTRSGISGRTACQTQEKQAHLADRGSDRAHHGGDGSGRAAVNCPRAPKIDTYLTSGRIEAGAPIGRKAWLASRLVGEASHDGQD